MKELSRSVIGTTTGPQTFEYSWRDCAIYALGVGAGPEEMEYLYEVGMKAIPSFGVVPYWGTFGITPPRDIPTPINCTMGLDRQGSLHMAHKLILYKTPSLNSMIVGRAKAASCVRTCPPMMRKVKRYSAI